MFRACKGSDYAVKKHTERASRGKLKLHLFKAQGKGFITQFNLRHLVKDLLTWGLCSEKLDPFQNLNYCLIEPQNHLNVEKNVKF